jgi:hypothetical protein
MASPGQKRMLSMNEFWFRVDLWVRHQGVRWAPTEDLQDKREVAARYLSQLGLIEVQRRKLLFKLLAKPQNEDRNSIINYMAMQMYELKMQEPPQIPVEVERTAATNP